MGVARARELESGWRELQRARLDGLGGGLELHQQGGDLDAPVRGAVGREAPACLLELAFAADPVTAPGLVPGNRDVNQPLEEVALGRLGEGRLEGKTLSCPWHGWQYDVTTGKNEFDHAIQLKTFEVKVEGGEVKVAI